MLKSNLQSSFEEFCKNKKFEINDEQLIIIDSIEKFLNPKKTFLKNFFNKRDELCFYLHGNVGVGKTMLMDFVFNELEIKKYRLHFNEFMISFHDFRHEKEDYNSIRSFVKNLKKQYELIYLDEFQVTNIVDAMILGKLFEVIFSENIKIIITTNIKLNDLYKDGLQREQFLPFISIIKNFSVQKELLLKDDYRVKNSLKQQGIFYPLNEKTSFKINKIFHEFTRNKKKKKKIITTKGRDFSINNFYSGIARFTFKDLCENNLGSEDYINIAKNCKHVFIDEIPIFNDSNSNQQLRFITLIDIFYEKKIRLTLSIEKNLNNLGSSVRHSNIFKRTISRLYEMTNNY